MPVDANSASRWLSAERVDQPIVTHVEPAAALEATAPETTPEAEATTEASTNGDAPSAPTAEPTEGAGA